MGRFMTAFTEHKQRQSVNSYSTPNARDAWPLLFIYLFSLCDAGPGTQSLMHVKHMFCHGFNTLFMHSKYPLNHRPTCLASDPHSQHLSHLFLLQALSNLHMALRIVGVHSTVANIASHILQGS